MITLIGLHVMIVLTAIILQDKRLGYEWFRTFHIQSAAIFLVYLKRPLPVLIYVLLSPLVVLAFNHKTSSVPVKTKALVGDLSRRSFCGRLISDGFRPRR